MDEKQKVTADEKEHELMESSGSKHLPNKAFESLSQQWQTMKKRVNKMQPHFNVGTIVLALLHDVDTTKADGKTLALIVVNTVQKRATFVKCFA